MTKNSNNESGCYIFLLIIGILFIFLMAMSQQTVDKYPFL